MICKFAPLPLILVLSAVVLRAAELPEELTTVREFVSPGGEYTLEAAQSGFSGNGGAPGLPQEHKPVKEQKDPGRD